ncbi:MAG TPA: phosphoglycerate dehydrogenase, partial [Variovorax sp.]|nr:phosphoglycerate dehydrogenase [Variovorax sp.]
MTNARTSLPKDKIHFLLLEGIHPSAVQLLHDQGYSQVEQVSGALGESELKARLADVHFLGIRSRTQLTRAVFEAAP